MNLKQAITVLDSTIPPSNNKMVDMEHLPIAQAWETIKAALKLGQIQTEGRLTAYNDGLPYFPECFKEPCSGMGCKKKDCEFMTVVCRKLAAFEDDEERHTPQLPEFWGDGYDENSDLIYDQAKCPNCGNDDKERAKQPPKGNRCSICGEKFDGRGHNAAPVNNGRCCEKCNYTVVTPARIKEASNEP